MTGHNTTDDEFGRRLSIALHESVPRPPADLLTDLDTASVRPLRRVPVARRAAPWLAAATVVLIAAVLALVASLNRGGGTRPTTGTDSSASVVSCGLGDATVTSRTETARQLRAVVRVAVSGTTPCLLPARPTVNFLARTHLPFLPMITYKSGAGVEIRVSGRAAEFTLAIDAGCPDPRQYASLTAGTTYGGIAPIDLAGAVCSVQIGDYRSVR